MGGMMMQNGMVQSGGGMIPPMYRGGMTPMQNLQQMQHIPHIPPMVPTPTPSMMPNPNTPNVSSAIFFFEFPRCVACHGDPQCLSIIRIGNGIGRFELPQEGLDHSQSR